MPNTILFILMMFLIMAVPVGLMVTLGVVVYKDAKAHNMSAGLWTAVAILAPNFIGVIIYLIVRSNQEKKLNCSNCQEEVKSDYNMCPNCQAVFENTCEVCKHAVNTQMAYCPYCGTHIEENVSHQTATKITKKTNIVKPLAIIGGIYVGIIVLVFGLMFSGAFIGNRSMTTTTQVSGPNIALMNIETSIGNHLKATFKYRQGKDSKTLTKQTGENIILDVDMTVKSGEILLTVLNPDKEVVFEKNYTESNGGETFTIPVEVEGKYKVNLQINGASGGYDVVIKIV